MRTEPMISVNQGSKFQGAQTALRALVETPKYQTQECEMVL